VRTCCFSCAACAYLVLTVPRSPDLAMQRVQLEGQLIHYRAELRALEDTILDKLESTVGDVSQVRQELPTLFAAREGCCCVALLTSLSTGYQANGVS
jgi:hypothetical protein